jgi:aminoglycoside phosphotransferase (APT) family kinase protein
VAPVERAAAQGRPVVDRGGMVIASTRDPAVLRHQLTTWFRGTLGPDADPEVSEVTAPSGTGMSSETLLFDVTAGAGADRSTSAYAARLAPSEVDHPVFPTYDLELQFRCLRLVREHSDVPVPVAPWYEPDPEPLGTPFFVMERVDGVVASDNPPYVFGGWVVDIGPEGRRELEDGLVDVMARLHAIDLERVDAGFLDRPEYGATPLDQHLGYQRWYYDWARGDRRFTQIDRALAWLEASRPEGEERTVINWGDSRLGNVMFRDRRPVAVLDWEMAALGAPEVDLAWAVHLNDFWTDLALRFEVDPLADFFQRDRVIATYEERSGRPVQNFDYYEVFAGLRYAIVSIRTGETSVETGQVEPPDHHDGLIMNSAVLERTLDRVGG